MILMLFSKIKRHTSLHLISHLEKPTMNVCTRAFEIRKHFKNIVNTFYGEMDLI